MVENYVEGKIKRLSLSIFCCILIAGVLFYLITDYKYVDSVLVEGNYYLSEEDVVLQSGLKDEQLYLATNKHKIQLLVESHPIIKSVEVTKQFPNNLTLSVKEHKVIGCLVDQGDYSQLFANGYRVSKPSISTCQGAIITGMDVYFYEHLLVEFANEFSSIDYVTISQVSETIYSPNEFNKKRIVSYMTDGNKIIYSVNTIEKLNHYNDMVHQIELKYGTSVRGTFDLEVGAFFTPYES